MAKYRISISFNLWSSLNKYIIYSICGYFISSKNRNYNTLIEY
jgi:hypothetical protein